MRESSKKSLNTEKKRGRSKNKKTDYDQKLSDQEARRLLAYLMDILPGTFYRCRIDRKWTMEFLSPGCFKLTGYEPEELIENKKIAFGDIIHPEDLGSGWEKIQEAIEQKHPFQHTYRIITKDGQLKWVWEQGNAVYSTNGEPVALEGIITDITDFKINEETLRRLAKETEIIANIGRIISSSLEIDEVYELFAEEVRKVIPFEWLCISVIDYDQQTFHNAHKLGMNIPERQPGQFIPLSGSLTEDIACRRSSCLIQGEPLEELSRGFPKLAPFLQRGFESFIAVPLISRDQVIAVLHIYSLKPSAYKERDLSLAESIGSQIAGAIANAQLYQEHKKVSASLQKSEEEARRLAKNNALVAEVGRIISSSLEIEKVYERFGQQVRKVIPFNWLAITIVDKEKGTFYNPHTLGDDIPERAAGEIIPLAGSFTEEVIRRRSGTLIQMEETDEIGKKIPKLAPFLQRGFRSFLAVPLIHLDEVIGALHIYSHESQAYTKNELILAESIVSQIAGAIANAQLFQAHKRTLANLQRSEEEASYLAKQNEIIANIGRIISSSLDIDKVYKLFAEEVHKVIPFNLIAITLIDHEKETFCPAYLAGAYVPGRTRDDIINLRNSFTEKVMLKKSGILLQRENESEMLSYSSKLSPFWERGFRSFMGIPLISHDLVIGVLHIYSQKTRAYTEADLNLAERIGNQIAGAIANAQLYEERQQALGQLKISEERYRNLVEHSPDMILLHDYEKYVYANPAAVKILGAARAEDIIGKPFWEIIHPDFWPIVKNRLAQLHSGNRVPLLEEKYHTLEGKVIEVEVVASPVFYQGQQLAQVVARDISERKEAERKMAWLQEQLRESQKLETVGRLAGGIAHDFNNLLTVIQGNCQLALLSLAENDPLRSNMEDILRAAQRAADLTRQMLAFGRRQILSLKIVDLNHIIRDMQKMIENLVGKDIEVITSLADKLGKVRVDPEQIKHVIMNLAINAKETMPQGGKLTIQTDNIDLKEDFVRTHPEMTPGRYVMLTVADTGGGIPPELKGRIFEPFFTTKEVGKGSGLGLSSVYGIIKQSGGNILVESELGKGTFFQIFLPQIEELSVAAEESKKENIFSLRKTVLVVEDNPQIREFVGQLLKKEGYLVLEAKNGQEALSLGHKFKEKIDLLLTELVMPEMSGADLAKALLCLHPEMKLLYLSDFEGRSPLNKEELNKELPYISKPFSIQGFKERVRSLLER